MTTQTERPMTSCPQCGVRVRVDRLEKHIRKTHQAGSRPTVKKLKSYVPKPASATEYAKWRCPYCGEVFSRSIRKKHRAACRLRGSNKGKEQSCPYCKTVLPGNELDAHLKFCPERTKMVMKSQDRVCPYCRQHLAPEKWKTHVSACKQKMERISASEHASQQQLTQKSYNRKVYISDKYGIVHDFKTWQKNQGISSDEHE